MEENGSAASIVADHFQMPSINSQQSRLPNNCSESTVSCNSTGFLDDEIHGDDNKPLSSEDEAIDLCRRALELAMERDGSSGGKATVFSLTPQGRRQVMIVPANPDDDQGADASSIPVR